MTKKEKFEATSPSFNGVTAGFNKDTGNPMLRIKIGIDEKYITTHYEGIVQYTDGQESYFTVGDYWQGTFEAGCLYKANRLSDPRPVR